MSGIIEIISQPSTSSTLSSTSTLEVPVSQSHPAPSNPQQVLSAGQPGSYPMSADMIQIANFRPTPRQVINGIAPHVFDERRRRRSQKRVPRPAYWYGQNGEKRSSPLRGAAALTWEEHSIYLEQPNTSQSLGNAAPEKGMTSVISLTPSGEDQKAMINQSPTPSLAAKSKWRSLRLDKRMLKNLRTKWVYPH